MVKHQKKSEKHQRFWKNHELAKLGVKIWAIIKNESENIECLSDIDKNIIYCELKDILSLKELINEESIDYFFHLAWAGVSGELRANYNLQLDNARACANVAFVASQMKCRRFIGLGSITEKMFVPYIQQDGCKPEMTSCYAVGKVAAQYMTRCICTEYGIEFVWGYISNFYGVGDKSQNFINFISRHYLSGNTPELTEGNQRADFMYVTDVAKAIICMAEKGNDMCSYYIGYGNPRPLKEFVMIVHDTIDRDMPSGLGTKEFRGQDINFEELDIQKLNRDTGFEPKVKFEDGYLMTLEWLKQQNVVEGNAI